MGYRNHMFLPGFRTVALAVTTIAAASLFQSSPANRPWPPGVQKVADDSPPLSPRDALATFYMAPGYRVELVASEPLVQAPVAIDWDLHGRLWVVEMPGYMRNVTGGNEHDPIGRVVVLEDTDRDGTMDKRTVFADGLVLARAIKVLEHGVLVGEPPNAWLMHDTNGDLRMDTKDLVTSEYGQLDADPQNNANGFFWAMDNRLYTAGQVDVSLHYKAGKFAVEKTLLRGEWGVTQDDAGRIFRNTNSSAVHADLVPTPYYARNRGPVADTWQLRGAQRRETNRSMRSGRFAPIPAPIARIRRASIVRTARWQATPRCAPRSSTVAIASRPIYTAIFSLPSPQPTWSAESSSVMTGRR